MDHQITKLTLTIWPHDLRIIKDLISLLYFENLILYLSQTLNTLPFKFEKLEIWNLALIYADEIHNLTRKFPKEEIFSLTSQFKRAVDSISLNISEGAIGQSNSEQIRFINYSIRSIAECVSCLYLSRKRNYISEEEFLIAYKKAEELFAKTNKFRNRLKN